MNGRCSLFAAALLCAVSALAQSPPPPASPPRAQPVPPVESPPPPPAQTPAPREGDPDEGLLEFLGSDDVGDATWWEFLKRSHPKGSNTAPAPDGKQ